MIPAIPFFDLKAQYRSIQSEIDAAMAEVFDNGLFVGGEFVEKFENEFARLHRVPHFIGVGNGTDAIFIALKCLGIGPGDEVVTPAFGWISASEMISLTGATPVFADVLPSGTLDPDQFERHITSDTRAVILIHLFGQAAAAEKIKSICDTRGIFLVEDCAQAHLTSENDKLVGSIGDVGTFSFYPTKNLGAYGDGGGITTRDESLAMEMRRFANHGGLNQHHAEGINSRLDTLQAAILSVKLSHLKKWTEARIKNASYYFSRMATVPEIILPEVRTGTIHTFHQFVIRTLHRDKLKDFLAEQGIQTLVHYPEALHNLKAYDHLGHSEQDFPIATQCQQQVLSLPIYPELSSEQIYRVCDEVENFFKK